MDKIILAANGLTLPGAIFLSVCAVCITIVIIKIYGFFS